MSELAFADIKGSLIEIHDRIPGEFRTIQVKCDLHDEKVRPIVIELDCKYVVSLSAGRAQVHIGIVV